VPAQAQAKRGRPRETRDREGLPATAVREALGVRRC
jgi:hypothetical protein